MSAPNKPRKIKGHAVAAMLREKLSITSLAGEVVCWSTEGKTTLQQIRQALETCGLEPKMARDLHPRYAFARACHEMEVGRIIKIVQDTPTQLHFQITREQKQEGEAPRMQYDFEAIVSLTKETGSIECEVPEIKEAAQKLLTDAMIERSASDVTALVQRLFNANADLFQVRPAGGVYFVPVIHLDFVERVHEFMKLVGGDMQRLPIPAGTANGDATIQSVVAGGLAGILKEHEEAIDEFDDETRDSVLERWVERVQYTEEKVLAYAAYLGVEQQKLLNKSSVLKQRLADKIGKVLESDTGDEGEAAATGEAAGEVASDDDSEDGQVTNAVGNEQKATVGDGVQVAA